MSLIRRLKLYRAFKQGLIRVVILNENNTLTEFYATPQEGINYKDTFRLLSPNAIYRPSENNKYKMIVKNKDGAERELEFSPADLFVDKKYNIPTVFYYGNDALPLSLLRASTDMPMLDANYIARVVLRAGLVHGGSVEKMLKLILFAVIGLAGLVLLLAGGGVR